MDKKNAIPLKGNEINVSVSVFLFKEKGAYIAYCPSLDISGYDLTEDKAKMEKMTPSERQEYREKLIKEGKYTWGEYEVWE